MTEPADITDAFMNDMLAGSRVYTAVFLRRTDKYREDAAPDSEQRLLTWEHGRRNFALRADGIMPLVGPMPKPPLAGFCVFAVPEDEARRLMDEDPVIIAGYFSYETAPWRTFPGSTLPEPGA